MEKLKHGYCIVTGGHKGQPAPDQSGTFPVIDPLRMFPETVDSYMMPFITARGTADMATLEQTRMPPEPGTVVECEWETGIPSSRRAIGIPTQINRSKGLSGGLDLANFGENASHSQKETGKRKTDGYQETSRDGVPVRIPKEGDVWNYDLTRGLTVDAAHYPLAGTIIPSLKSIETAVQQAASIINPSMLSQLPGQIMSIASMFKGMSDDQKQRAKSSMSEDVAEGFESMINLIQTADGSSSFVTGHRCNTEVYMENCIDLLSQCTNLSDLYDCMHRIQHDKKIRGLETLPKAKIKSESAFGTFSYDMDAEGTLVFDDVDSNTANISVSTMSLIFANTPNVNVAATTSRTGQKNSSQNGDVLQKIQQIVSLLSSGATNTGPSRQVNMWKNQAGKVTEAMGRLPPNIGSQFLSKTLQRAAHASSTAWRSEPELSKIPFPFLS